jgi:hypothetical protein
MPSRSGREQWRTPPWSPGERAMRASLFTDRAIAIPAEVLADRDRRLSVEPTVHMRLLGDPVGRARQCAEDDPRCGMRVLYNCDGELLVGFVTSGHRGRGSSRVTLAIVPRHGAVFSACAVRGVGEGCWRPASLAA